MKKFIGFIAIILVMFSFVGCNEKVSYYNNGGKLVCIKKNLLSENESTIIDKDNSDYGDYSGRFEVPRYGFWKNGQFYDEDDCAPLNNN